MIACFIIEAAWSPQEGHPSCSTAVDRRLSDIWQQPCQTMVCITIVPSSLFVVRHFWQMPRWVSRPTVISLQGIFLYKGFSFTMDFLCSGYEGIFLYKGISLYKGFQGISLYKGFPFKHRGYGASELGPRVTTCFCYIVVLYVCMYQYVCIYVCIYIYIHVFAILFLLYCFAICMFLLCCFSALGPRVPKARPPRRRTRATRRTRRGPAG